MMSNGKEYFSEVKTAKINLNNVLNQLHRSDSMEIMKTRSNKFFQTRWVTTNSAHLTQKVMHFQMI